MTSPLVRSNVVIMSRCARTLYQFRRSLARHIADTGARVVLVGAAGDGFEARLSSDGFEFHHVPVSFRGVDVAGDLRLWRSFFDIFRKVRPQVVHAFTVKPAIYGTLAAAMAGVPVRIVTITGLGHAFTTASMGVRKVVEVLYRAALRHAHLVFFQNPADRALFVERGLVEERRTRLIGGSGVDLEKFSPAPLPCARGTPPVFLMIARLLREKGVVEYVQAARIVRKQFPNVRFRLLGGTDPRNPSSLRQEGVAALKDDGAVDWIDEVDDVRPHIAESDVIVLPSYREGLPRVLLEGAAMGRASIASDAVGCRDAVESGVTGLLVPVGDVDALANAMMQLVREPALIHRMGAAARAWVAERFDERVVIRDTLKAYEELLASKVGDGYSTPASRAQ